MKLKKGMTGLSLRLGAMAGVLLFGQQAMAIGTAAGTLIDNTVTVDYFVGGIDQDDLTSSVSFVVDRRVDFSLDLVGGALVNVAPGGTDVFDLQLTNDSNSPLDFSLALAQLLNGVTVRAPDDDSSDMLLVDYGVWTASVGTGGGVAPARGAGAQFVDQLAADDSIFIRVFGDADLAMIDGDVAGVQLDATAREPASGAVGVLTEDANTDAGIENVFANLSGGGVEAQIDGFLVVSASLVVVKDYEVIDGHLGSFLPIPGATVEYTVTVTNSSTTAADDVRLDDVLSELGNAVVLILNVGDYGGNDIDVDNAGAPLVCDVEANGDGDGCDLAGLTITVGASDLVGGITVAGGTTLTIMYRVTIDDPDPTP